MCLAWGCGVTLFRIKKGNHAETNDEPQLALAN